MAAGAAVEMLAGWGLAWPEAEGGEPKDAFKNATAVRSAESNQANITPKSNSTHRSHANIK